MKITEDVRNAIPTVELPYVKPTSRVHNSGYRMFEVGTCIRKLGDARIESKVIHSTGSDSINIAYDRLPGGRAIQFDLTKDGYICFFPDLEWGLTGDTAYLRKKSK